MAPKQRTMAIFLTVGIAYVLWGLFFSLQPPFYPAEAEKKGATPAQYAFVYGMVHLGAFLFSPFFARYGHALGAKAMFITGSLVQGVVSVLFGLLEFIEDSTTFITLSYILRFVFGAADAACISGVLAILIDLYPKRVASVVAMGETLFGLGFAIGPAVGSLLYALDGFYLPFVVTGILIILTSGICMIMIPVRERKQNSVEYESLLGVEERKEKQHFPLITVLKECSVLVPLVDAAIFCCCLGMIEALLAPHLSAAGASETGVALNFTIIGVVYMLVTPFLGMYCDKSQGASLQCSIVGNVLSSLSLMLMGPAPILSWLIGPTSPTLINVASAILGVAEGLVIVSTFLRTKVAIVTLGFEDDVRTYIAVSSTWFGAFYLGNTIGPLVGGFLVEWLGFSLTAFLYALIFVLPCGLNIAELRKTQHSSLT